MIRKDYILKLIDQLVITLKKVQGLKDREDYEEALEFIAEKKEAFLEIDAAYFDSLEAEDLDLLLKNDTQRGKEIWQFTANLLFEEAAIYDVLDQEAKVFRAYHQAMIILTYLIKQNREISITLFEKLSTCVEYLRDFRLPLSSYAKIIEYYTATHKLDRAEDMLFQALQAHLDQKEALLEMAHLFYGELLEFDNQTLKEGKLPRKEVEAGLRAFEKKIGEL
ncbi:MAG TPA: hypothetical protein DCS93_28485 [Microscillaceae bacterium]|nr:hypothetical protein [Microscillaceae bacterium]